MDILALLKSMDKDTLDRSIAQAKAYLATEEGRKSAKLLSEGKMPDGSNIPEELKTAAEAIKNDKAAQKALKAFTSSNG